jgi:hypothetical protein
MFAGHCGPGFVAKRFEGSILLWVLFIAARVVGLTGQSLPILRVSRACALRRGFW